MTAINNMQKSLLKQWIKNRVDPYQFDNIDFDYELDSSLTYEENKTYFEEKYGLEDESSVKEMIEQYRFEEVQSKKKLNSTTSLNLWQQLHSVKCIAAAGLTGSGKTAISYNILDAIKDHKPVFVYKHPRPELLVERGYGIITDNFQLIDLEDCALWIDEPQLWFKSKKGQTALVSLLTFARQKDITLILSTSDTRFFTAEIEYHVEAWFVKDIEPKLVKRGSMIKEIVKSVCHDFIGLSDFRLRLDQFVFYSRKLNGFNGMHTAPLPKGWSEIDSKPYKKSLRQQNETETIRVKH